MAQIPGPAPGQILAPQMQRQLGTYQPGAVQRAQEAEGAAAAQFGQAAEKTGTQLLDVQDRMNAAAAEQTFLSKKLDIDEQFAKDTDYPTLPQRYRAAMQGALNQTSQIIGSPVQRSDFTNRMARWVEYGTNQALRESQARWKDDVRGGTLDAYNNGIQDALRAPETEAAGILNSVRDRIDAGVASGAVSQTEGARMHRELGPTYAEKRMKMLLDTDPEAAKKFATPEGWESAPGLASKRPALSSAITGAAKTYGVDPVALTKTAYLETRGGTVPDRPGSAITGPFQFTPKTAAQYGVTDPTDPAQATDGAARLMADNKMDLAKSLGRDPTGAELYLGHQQGAAGAAVLLKNPDMLAVDALGTIMPAATARQNIVGNGGSATMTAGDFVAKWQQKYDAAPASLGSNADVAAEPAALHRPTATAASWVDQIPPDKRLDFARQAQLRADQQTAARDMNEQRAQRLAEKQAKEQADAAGKEYLTAIEADPTKVDPMAIVKDPRLPWQQAEHIREILRKSLTKDESHDDKTYGPGFWSVFQGIHAEPGNPDLITDPAVIYRRAASEGDLTVAGVNEAVREIAGKGTPESASEGELKRSFLATAKGQITGSSAHYGFRDQHGDELFQKFLTQAIPAWEKARKDGTPAADLADPSDKNPLWKMAMGFKRKPDEWMKDITTDFAPPDTKATGLYGTPEDVKAAYAAGKFGTGPAAYDAAMAELERLGVPRRPQVPQR
jgi:hypothetical protein